MWCADEVVVGNRGARLGAVMVVGAGAEDIVVVQGGALAGAVDGLVVEVEKEVIVRSMGRSASHWGSGSPVPLGRWLCAGVMR